MKKLTLSLIISASLFAASSHAADNQRTISYLTSWGAANMTPELIKKSEVDTLLLAFGSWDAQGNISGSDNMFNSGSDTYWKPMEYLNWTQAKFDNPNLKLMLAFGGEKGEGLWADLHNENSREKIAQGLVKLLKKDFPVYKKNGQYQKVGTIRLDGVDFDYEKQARLTEEENHNLLKLATRVRALLGANSGKLLSLTTYHVGADPVSCLDNLTAECSYNGKTDHSGEVLTLLKEGKSLFDFFNVMTYDAGPDFKYKVAMENYSKVLGDKSKIILGNTINDQWGPNGRFVEPRANNIYRAGWQAENNFGGFFVWALGASPTLNMQADKQVDYVLEMKDAAENASPGDVNQAPVAKVSFPQVIVGAASHVELDGSASSDPEQQPLTFHWKQISGSKVKLTSQHDKAFFSLPAPGKTETLHFQLTVNDGERNSTPFDIIIKHQAEQAGNNAPVADAGSAQTVESNQKVTLNGSASHDPDNDTLTYSWVQKSGKKVTLSHPNSVKTTFTTPDVQKDETLVFTLKVSDGQLQSHADVSVVVKAKSVPDVGGDSWVSNKQYKPGDMVTDNGAVYRCLQGHLSASHWAPHMPGLASLWQKQ
jgi:chitinase